MPYFRYKAADRQGLVVSGELHALNEVDVELRLRQMGLVLIRLRARGGSRHIAWRGRVSRRDLIGFCFHIQQLSRAGVPLLEGLRDLITVTGSSSFRDVLSLVADDLEGGKLLSQALSAHPQVFDAVFVNLVRAAEASDQLVYAFAQLEERLKVQDELESEFTRLLIYPSVVGVAVLAAAGVLLFYLTPRLAVLVHSMNIPVPVLTHGLLAGSGWVLLHWPWLLAGLAGLAALLALTWRHSESFQEQLDALWLRLPAIGEAARKNALARYTSLLALLTQSGLNILEALSACEKSVGNRHLAGRLARASQLIASGKSVSESFRLLNIFPPLVLRMLYTGEKSGTLIDALNNTAWFFARDARETTARAMKLLEPALALLLGSLLAFLLLAVFLPVYQVIGEIQL